MIRTTTPRDTPRPISESWRLSITLTQHMWRFFISYQDTRPEEMAPAARAAWETCNAIWKTRSEIDRGIIREYHTIPKEADHKEEVRKIGESYMMSAELVMAFINDLYRKTAIKRGIADR